MVVWVLEIGKAAHMTFRMIKSLSAHPVPFPRTKTYSNFQVRFFALEANFTFFSSFYIRVLQLL